jgi:adenylyltransferase/sulfurtransferase
MPEGKFPVIGVTPAIIGCIQASEVIKYITGLGEMLSNRLLVYDGLSMKFTEFKVRKDPKCHYCAHLTPERKAD